ncbi:MAG: hypothetical protein JXB14_04960, partial [Candidatus Altiarchaeota archaeon]|nr:hypothetical protein [Candidatus Altiarchaeota archaeon]
MLALLTGGGAQSDSASHLTDVSLRTAKDIYAPGETVEIILDAPKDANISAKVIRPDSTEAGLKFIVTGQHLQGHYTTSVLGGYMIKCTVAHGNESLLLTDGFNIIEDRLGTPGFTSDVQPSKKPAGETQIERPDFLIDTFISTNKTSYVVNETVGITVGAPQNTSLRLGIIDPLDVFMKLFEGVVRETYWTYQPAEVGNYTVRAEFSLLNQTKNLTTSFEVESILAAVYLSILPQFFESIIVNETYLLRFIVSNLGAKTEASLDVDVPEDFDSGDTEFNFTIEPEETKVLNTSITPRKAGDFTIYYSLTARDFKEEGEINVTVVEPGIVLVSPDIYLANQNGTLRILNGSSENFTLSITNPNNFSINVTIRIKVSGLRISLSILDTTFELDANSTRTINFTLTNTNLQPVLNVTAEYHDQSFTRSFALEVVIEGANQTVAENPLFNATLGVGAEYLVDEFTEVTVSAPENTTVVGWLVDPLGNRRVLPFTFQGRFVSFFTSNITGEYWVDVYLTLGRWTKNLTVSFSVVEDRTVNETNPLLNSTLGLVGNYSLNQIVSLIVKAPASALVNGRVKLPDNKTKNLIFNFAGQFTSEINCTMPGQYLVMVELEIGNWSKTLTSSFLVSEPPLENKTIVGLGNTSIVLSKNVFMRNETVMAKIIAPENVTINATLERPDGNESRLAFVWLHDSFRSSFVAGEAGGYTIRVVLSLGNVIRELAAGFEVVETVENRTVVGLENSSIVLGKNVFMRNETVMARIIAPEDARVNATLKGPGNESRLAFVWVHDSFRSSFVAGKTDNYTVRAVLSLGDTTRELTAGFTVVEAARIWLSNTSLLRKQIVEIYVSAPRDASLTGRVTEPDGSLKRVAFGWLGDSFGGSFLPSGLEGVYKVHVNLTYQNWTRSLDTTFTLARAGKPVNVSEPVLSLPENKQVFMPTEDVVLSFEIPLDFVETAEPRLSASLWQAGGSSIETSLYYNGQPTDIKSEITEEQPGKFSIRIPNPRGKRAGLYTLKLSWTSDGETRVYEQDFTWGVLAINTDKSVYLPREKASIGMAVLDDLGHMVCDAELVLTIQEPGGTITT